MILESIIFNSTTYDECKHIATGLNFIENGSCCLGVDNTPFTAIVAAPIFIYTKVTGDEFNCNNKILPSGFESRTIDNITMLRLGRIPNMFIALIGGFFVYLLTKKLYSKNAGILSLFLYSINPNIIAHASVATQDIQLTGLLPAALYFFYSAIFIGGTISYILLGVFTGLIILSKLNGLFILLSYVIFLFTKRKSIKGLKIRKLLISLIVCIMIFKLGYNNINIYTPLSSLTFQSSVMNKLRKFLPVVLTTLPKGYLTGVDQIIEFQQNGWGGYMFREYYPNGSFLYESLSFLVKSPTIILILLVIYLTKYRILKNEKDNFILIPLIIFIILNFPTRINLGIRHILPIYGLLSILLGHTLYKILQKYKYFTYILIALSLIELMQSHPNNISFFNILSGGPKNGYKYLADSNIDWGQEQFLINKYANINQNIIINPDCSYKAGIIALNLNSWLGVIGKPHTNNVDCYKWINDYPVVDRVGFTWFIFNTEKKI